MKKRIANLLFLLSILIGVGMGFVRSNIFLKHYDGFTGVVLNTASLSLTLLTAFLVIFAIAVFIICRRFFSSCQISRKLSLIDKILILVGSVSIGISAYLAFTMQGGFFEKTFAVSAVVAIIYFALVVMNAKGTMVDLLSCASVLPAALILLSIYKTNIRFPNISLFAFEVLAALFLMLGFYFISARSFKHVTADMPVWVVSLGIMFSLSSIVTHHLVIENYIFEPVMSRFAPFYFIGAFLVLIGFTSSPEAEKQEKIILNGDGFVIANGETQIGFDAEASRIFLSCKAETEGRNVAVTEEDSYFSVKDFSVCGFVFDGEGEPIFGQHITTPNGVTLLNLTQASPANIGKKLVKKLRDEYSNVDYIIVKSNEDMSALLSLVIDDIKHKNILVLSLEDGFASLNEKMVFTTQGEYVL